MAPAEEFQPSVHWWWTFGGLQLPTAVEAAKGLHGHQMSYQQGSLQTLGGGESLATMTTVTWEVGWLGLQADMTY